MDIQGKVFIVTGGASGLGEGTARMLAANGGTVVIAGELGAAPPDLGYSLTDLAGSTEAAMTDAARWISEAATRAARELSPTFSAGHASQ